MRALRLALPPLALLLAAAAPLELPPPIAVPQPAEAGRVAGAIRAALAERHWRVRAESLDAVTAEREARGRTLRVRLDVTPDRIEVRYLDSERLGFEAYKGERFIDPDANDWLAELEDALRAQLQRAAFEREPVEVVPVGEAPPVR